MTIVPLNQMISYNMFTSKLTSLNPSCLSRGVTRQRGLGILTFHLGAERGGAGFLTEGTIQPTFPPPHPLPPRVLSPQLCQYWVMLSGVKWLMRAGKNVVKGYALKRNDSTYNWASKRHEFRIWVFKDMNLAFSQVSAVSEVVSPEKAVWIVFKILILWL